MKTSIFIFMPLTLFFIAGCNGNNGGNKQQSDTLASTKQDCYIATFQKDTAHLVINTLQGTKISGTLLIQYGNNPKNDGELSGNLKGDTLFADYTYTVGTYKKQVNKNPLAFLVKGDSLILGIGQIETKAGRSYFTPGMPINFDRGRFRFTKADCND